MKFITRFFSRRESPDSAEERFLLAKRLEAQQDFVQAFFWYEKAASQGHTNAQNNLGLLYERGKGVAPDSQRAMSLYRRAAELGNAKAQHNLGRMYHTGEAVERDYPQALFWYLEAVENDGVAHSLFALGSLYYAEDFPQRDLAKAVEYWRQSALKNLSEGQFRLGYEYHQGGGVEIDLCQAVYWYQLAAEQDHPSALFNLAHMYYSGEAGREDPERGLSYLRRSAELGCLLAQLDLSDRYIHGDGAGKDLAEALRWCETAAEQGSPEAQYNLVIFYLKSGDAAQRKRAFDILHTLAAQSVANAQFLLGALYQEGELINPEPELAIYWYTKAAELGHRGAQQSLIAAQNMDIRLDRYAPDITMRPESLPYGQTFISPDGKYVN